MKNEKPVFITKFFDKSCEKNILEQTKSPVASISGTSELDAQGLKKTFLAVINARLSKLSSILFSLLVISFIPIAFFLVFDYSRAEGYIAGLFTGHGRISFDVARNWFDIYSTVYFGSIRFSLTYIVLLVTSFVVFSACLALIARRLYFALGKKKG